MKKLFALILLAIFSLNCLASENAEAKEARISFTDATVLGIVEGLTEYLPVSSTGHLILANKALGLDSEEAIKEAKEEPYTVKMAADSYSVVIQIGAIFAVIFVYSANIKSMFWGILGKDKNGLLLLRNIIVAFLPAAIIGFVLHDFIHSFLFGIYPVITALFLGGILMLFVQNRYEKQAKQNPDIELSSLSAKQSLVVGFLQCVAMCPGTSRSMMTILGGYLIGLNPVCAAKFSFLLGLVTLSAASAYKLLFDGAEMFTAISLGNALWGVFLSFVFAVICVKLFVKILAKWGLALFAWYRIIFSLILLVVFYNA